MTALRSQPIHSSRAAALFVLASLPAFPAMADEQQDRKFFFNANITQAWGQTDGGHVLGLDEHGTFDYRTAALLGRYELTKKDHFVLQLSHESVGASHVGEHRDEVEIDWVFYERLFPADINLRIGRVPIPFGIYNEIRDVGPVLEFYRPPVSIYFEGAFAAESVDGIVIGKRFFASKPWSLDLDLYAGSWDRDEFISAIHYDGKAKNALGAQLWLQTPIEGLRLGAAYQRFDQEDGATFLRHPETDRFEIQLVSLDANLERFVFRAEAQWLETAFNFSRKVDIPGYYALAGWRFTDQLEIHAMFETSSSRWKTGPGQPLTEMSPFFEDRAVAFLYRLSQKMLIRAEAHHFETLVSDVPLPPGQSTVRTDYAILSFTWSY
jgi:hypothetical protein